MKTFKEFLKEQSYVVEMDDIKAIWRDANEKIFHGQLDEPKFTLEDDLNYLLKRYKDSGEAKDGHILGFCDKEGSKIILRFSRKIRSPRELLETVVHEMVHQAEAERTTYLTMHADPHGEDFLAWAEAVSKYYNLNLRGMIE